jgi:hypothetical protein
MGLTEIYAASCRYYYKIVEQIGLSPKLLYINYDVQIGENKYIAHSVIMGLRVGF